jgi:ABC-type transport system involved in multi-copper enzyme maturation permease subunit
VNGAGAVMRYTLLELSRRRILLVFFALGAVGTLLLGVGLKILYTLAGSGAFTATASDPARFQKFLQLSFLSDLYGALGIFALLIAYAIGMTAIYHDLESGAAVSIFSKPVSRLAFSAGKVAAAVAALVVIVGLLAVEARLVMLLFQGGLEGSLTGEVVAVTANSVVVMLLVLALSTWMNNIVAAIVAFVYYSVITGVINAVHNLADSGAFNNDVVKGVFDVLYWLVPHALVSSAPGDLVRAQIQLSNAASSRNAVQTAALIPPASGLGDILWWAFFVVLFSALLYWAVRRRQV